MNATVDASMSMLMLNVVVQIHSWRIGVLLRMRSWYAAIFVRNGAVTVCGKVTSDRACRLASGTVLSAAA